METLRDVMSTLLVTVAEDATVAEAAQVMSLLRSYKVHAGRSGCCT